MLYVLSPQSCRTLWPVDCSPPGSSVHGDSPGKNTEWVAMPFSRGSSWPRDRTRVSCIGFFTSWATRETLKKRASGVKNWARETTLLHVISLPLSTLKQVRRPGCREGRILTQGHTATRWWSCSLNPGSHGFQSLHIKTRYCFRPSLSTG